MSQKSTAPLEEEDWETGEIIVAPRAILRPTAHEFRPRLPTDGSQQPSGNPATGPSLHTASGGVFLLARPSSGGRGIHAAAREGGDGDDWFRDSKPATNRQIWDSANSRPASNTTILSPTPLPQPKVQLLRRPNSGTCTPSSDPSSLPSKVRTKTLEEREEEYKLARERIFGTTAPGVGGAPSSAVNDVAGGASGGCTPGRVQEQGAAMRTSPNADGASQDDRRCEGNRSRGVNSPRQSGGASWDGLVPSQIRGTGRYLGVAGGGPKTGGVLRQPTGPQGGGFEAGFGRGKGM